MKSIIILSGPVGAGKSTIAPELVKLLPGPVVYIEGDKFWGFMAKDWEEFSLKENFTVTIRSMTVATIPYARAGYSVILDFSIPPWYLAAVKKILEARDIPLDYVVLKPDVKICEARAANRCEGQITDYGRYQKLYDSFKDVERYTIPNDDTDAATVAQQIAEGLNEGIFRVKD